MSTITVDFDESAWMFKAQTLYGATVWGDSRESVVADVEALNEKHKDLLPEMEQEVIARDIFLMQQSLMQGG